MPFIPDDWQQEAVEAIAHTDVIVSAPTGSGKTFVAIEAIKAGYGFQSNGDLHVAAQSPLQHQIHGIFTMLWT